MYDEQERNEEPRREKSEDSWWEDRSLPVKILMGIGFAILGIGLIALFVFITQSLWNWLMPDIFGLKTISFWQAGGLMLLCFILFKNWGGGESSSSRSKERKRKKELRKYMEDDEA